MYDPVATQEWLERQALLEAIRNNKKSKKEDDKKKLKPLGKDNGSGFLSGL